MTQESIRKHISQMSEEEITYCKSFLKTKEWFMSGHVEGKLKERGGDLGLLLETIGYGELIEYHKRNGTSRLLLRSNRAIHNYVPCVVVAPLAGRIITVYWNHILDHHRTIDMERYNPNLDVMALLKQELEVL